jgi:hypothetical protein
LANEVRELLHFVYLDPDAILADEEVAARIPRLKAAKDHIIRSEIVVQYVLMDELLNMRIRRYYFGRRNYRQLWKTKRFKSFQHFVLDKIYLLQKLELLSSLRPIPKFVRSDLAALNDLRNAVAHSFFPETRRRPPEWKKQNIFTAAGFQHFSDDMERLSDFFVFGASDESNERANSTVPKTGVN